MISVYLFCPILCRLLGPNFSVLLCLDFSALLCPSFSAMSIKLIAMIDTSCVALQKTPPNLPYYLHCLVKTHVMYSSLYTPNDSYFSYQGQMQKFQQGWGGGRGTQGTCMRVTCFTLHTPQPLHYTFYNLLLLCTSGPLTL